MKWTHLTVFDLDRTLIQGNCSFDFCRYLVATKVLSPFALYHSLVYYIRHHFLGMGLLDLHEQIFSRLLKGRIFQEIEEKVDSFLKEYSFSKIYLPCFNRLRLAQHLGHYTLILSNSPSFLVKKVAHLFGVDGCYSTEYGVDRENRLSHISFIVEGKQKAFYVQEVAKKLSISKNQITAYSDSVLDVPLLCDVGSAVVVNPDLKLKEMATKNRWEIL